jgi:hypothetical protein
MREKLNSDPKAQVLLVLVLVAVAGFMFMKMNGGESESEEVPPTEASVSVAGTGVTGTATGATPGEAVEGAVESAIESVAEGGAAPTSVPTSVPAPPLPRSVAGPYDEGRTVAILFVHDGGIDDRIVRRASAAVESVPDVALQVVPARKISRYAAVTLGVQVQQVPALVVMRPRSLSGGVPQASASYGFQTPQTIVQAVRDAAYSGPEKTYHPE